MDNFDPELLIRLRKFAQEPGALFIPVYTNIGRILVWADDINDAETEDDLIQLIKKTRA